MQQPSGETAREPSTGLVTPPLARRIKGHVAFWPGVRIEQQWSAAGAER